MTSIPAKKQTPLLFKPYMVNAVLAEMKLQTRRMDGLEIVNKDPNAWNYDGSVFINKQPQGGKIQTVIPVCPYGKPGDLLWGREKFSVGEDVGEGWFPGAADGDLHVIYDADSQRDYLDFPLGYQWPRNAKETHNSSGTPEHWISYGPIPSIFMPKFACRLWLEIRKIRIERLRDITDSDAVLEGTYIKINEREYGAFSGGVRSDIGDKWVLMPGVPRQNFLTLFASIHGQALVFKNPWLWVISFEKVEAPL